MNLFQIIGIVVLNLIILEIYFYLADKYQIIDKPNKRSSHSVVTIRGGGIVFIFGAIIFSLLFGFAYPFLIVALVITGVVSFWDDVQGVSRRIRFLSHLLAIALVLKECGLIQLNWWIFPLFILLIGIVNAYNFMDGINGLTGLYSLTIFVPFWILENDFLHKEFLLFSILSLVVFLFFNARKKARCFAGDIGSIGIALMVLFVLLHNILETGNFQFVFFLTIYGVDSILTISQRLINAENIFEPHRKHLYQILVNEYKLPHLLISGIYASIQLIINSWIIVQKPSNFIVIITVSGIGFIYIGLKYFLIGNFSKKHS